LIVNNGGSIVTLEAHGHGERGSLGLSSVVCVKVLNFDLLLVLVCIVEHEHLHGVLEGSWVLELNVEASGTEFVLTLLPSVSKLDIKLLEFARWRSLCTLLGDFVGCSWCLNLEVNFLVLIDLDSLLEETFIPYILIMLIFFIFRLVTSLLTLLEFFNVLLIFLILLFFSVRFTLW